MPTSSPPDPGPTFAPLADARPGERIGHRVVISAPAAAEAGHTYRYAPNVSCRGPLALPVTWTPTATESPS